MKFGKSLKARLNPDWETHYVDYKRLKKAVKKSLEHIAMCASALRDENQKGVKPDHSTAQTMFRTELEQEVSKVNSFYIAKVKELAVRLEKLQHEINQTDGERVLSPKSPLKRARSVSDSSEKLAESSQTAARLAADKKWGGPMKKFSTYSREVDQLRQYVVLNYLAFVKITKKFDHATGFDIRDNFLLYLTVQPFYNCADLAVLVEETEALSSQIMSGGEIENVKREALSCAFCLQVLLNPVRLSCEHRFCWSCVAKKFLSGPATCPVCKTEQTIDVKNFQIDSVLERFVRLYFPDEKMERFEETQKSRVQYLKVADCLRQTLHKKESGTIINISVSKWKAHRTVQGFFDILTGVKNAVISINPSEWHIVPAKQSGELVASVVNYKMSLLAKSTFDLSDRPAALDTIADTLPSWLENLSDYTEVTSSGIKELDKKARYGRFTFDKVEHRICYAAIGVVDFCLLQTRLMSNDKKFVAVVFRSVTHHAVAERPNRIRARLYPSGWLIRPPTCDETLTRVTALINFDCRRVCQTPSGEIHQTMSASVVDAFQNAVSKVAYSCGATQVTQPPLAGQTVVAKTEGLETRDDEAVMDLDTMTVDAMNNVSNDTDDPEWNFSDILTSDEVNRLLDGSLKDSPVLLPAGQNGALHSEEKLMSLLSGSDFETDANIAPGDLMDTVRSAGGEPTLFLSMLEDNHHQSIFASPTLRPSQHFHPPPPLGNAQLTLPTQSQAPMTGNSGTGLRKRERPDDEVSTATRVGEMTVAGAPLPPRSNSPTVEGAQSILSFARGEVPMPPVQPVFKKKKMSNNKGNGSASEDSRKGGGSKTGSENTTGDATQSGGETKKKEAGRLIWTAELHDCFLRAVDQLGLETAKPQAILSVMNVSGLTTDHIKSHLQKYRQSIQRNRSGSGSVGRSHGRMTGSQAVSEPSTFEDLVALSCDVSQKAADMTESLSRFLQGMARMCAQNQHPNGQATPERNSFTDGLNSVLATSRNLMAMASTVNSTLPYYLNPANFGSVIRGESLPGMMGVAVPANQQQQPNSVHPSSGPMDVQPNGNGRYGGLATRWA